MQPFVHLRVYSSYSLAQSTLKINDIIDLAKKHDMPAVGISDIANLFGSLEFSYEASKNGIKPIISCQVPILTQLEYDKYEIDFLRLYAQNQVGYNNLLKIVSNIYTKRHLTKINELFVTEQDVFNHSEGIIILTAAENGRIERLLNRGHKDQAANYLKNLSSIFKDRIFVEISRENLNNNHIKNIEENLINFAYDQKLPLIATNPVFYNSPIMHEAHDALLCIANSSYLTVENRAQSSVNGYFKSQQEMNELFSDLPEALTNTLLLAKRCSIMSDTRSPMLPNFTNNEDNNEEDLITKIADEGLVKRFNLKKIIENIDQENFTKVFNEYKQRLDFELKVITSMKFSGYFLIVSDFIKWSKNNNIPVGPGRGSGAGSLVAWCLEITDIDPIKFGLLFERFLNPDRISMPDFDIDFCQERRDEVIEYVRKRYGHSRVAQIITFGKLQARAVLRDVGRVMQLSYGLVDRICKMVPQNPANPVNLSQAIELEPNLSQAIAQDDQIAKMVDISLKLEGLYRHASTHAAGVVIADRDLVELVPLYSDNKSDIPVVQYSMKYAEMAGLVKFDFLGLKTLTVIQHTLNMLELQDIKIDIQKIDFHDLKTYQMLSLGDAVGVFQFESRGMRDTLRKLRPDSIEDLIALGALYRPGPMDNIPSYIARKHGTEVIDYIHPLLEPVLKETFGVIIYQEQVMKLAQILAGYSLGAADILRKAMGKKIKSEMDDQREIFILGSIKNNIEAEQASQIFDLVAKFASYGFNKSHAAAYGLISYQTAYLKANYRVEFLIANLNLELDNTDKIAIFLQEAKNAKIKILAPDINLSIGKFTIEYLDNGEKAIRYGLAAIKNIGEAVINELIKERDNKGKFASFVDLLGRSTNLSLNKKFFEHMAKAGVFDSIYYNRREIVENLDYILKYCDITKQDMNSNQLGLFSMMKEQVEITALNLFTSPQFNFESRLEAEYQAFGFYLTEHPLDKYKDYINKFHLSDYETLQETLGYEEKSFQLAVVPVEIKMRVSQKGRFAYIAVSDPIYNFEVSIFDQELLDNSRSYFESRKPLCLDIDAYRDDSDGIRLIVRKVDYLENMIIARANKIKIHTSNSEIFERLSLCSVGYHQIQIHFEMNNHNLYINLPDRLKIDLKLIEDLRDLSELVEME